MSERDPFNLTGAVDDDLDPRDVLRVSVYEDYYKPCLDLRPGEGTHALVPWEEWERVREAMKPDTGWPSYSVEWVAGWQQGYKDCENAALSRLFGDPKELENGDGFD